MKISKGKKIITLKNYLVSLTWLKYFKQFNSVNIHMFDYDIKYRDLNIGRNPKTDFMRLPKGLKVNPFSKFECVNNRLTSLAYLK